jgi:hypothetical protein
MTARFLESIKGFSSRWSIVLRILSAKSTRQQAIVKFEAYYRKNVLPLLGSGNLEARELIENIIKEDSVFIHEYSSGGGIDLDAIRRKMEEKLLPKTDDAKPPVIEVVGPEDAGSLPDSNEEVPEYSEAELDQIFALAEEQESNDKDLYLSLAFQPEELDLDFTEKDEKRYTELAVALLLKRLPISYGGPVDDEVVEAIQECDSSMDRQDARRFIHYLQERYAHLFETVRKLRSR